MLSYEKQYGMDIPLESPKFQKMYETYIKKYNETKKKQGGFMYLPPSTPREYRFRYIAARNTQEDKIEAGKIKGRTNLANKLVRDDATLLTGAERNNWSKVVKKLATPENHFKERFSREKLKKLTSRDELTDLAFDIKVRRNELFRERFENEEEYRKLSKEDKKKFMRELYKTIAHEYFGSPD